MGLKNAVERWFDDFIGHGKHPATAAGVGAPWAGTITGTTPTFVNIASIGQGVVRLQLTSTSEAQIATLSFGDILSFLAEKLKRVTFRVKVTVDITTAQALIFGMTSARADDADATTYNVQFKCAASTAVVLESDDNTTDNDDKASGETLSTTFKEFVIDFSAGLADVRFYISDSGGKLKRVAKATTFNFSGAAAAYLQPNIQLQKASGTTVPAVDVDYVEIEYVR